MSLDVDVPSVVSVVEEGASAGQVWTRLYAHKEGLPQVIHSVKRFSGATGLEEYLGYGLSVALRLSVERGALCFRSAFYQLHLGRKRLRLPDILSPGSLKVVHEETKPGEFIFSLRLRHNWFGELVYQEGVYRDAR